MSPRGSGSDDAFDGLLLRVLDDRSAETELYSRYGRDRTVMIVDFTGMRKRSDAEGIVYALAVVHAARAQIQPVIHSEGGVLVKQVADTIYATFDAPLPALRAAFAAVAALRTFNAQRTGHLGDGRRNDPIHPCVGLGSGESLVLPNGNLYGAEVNRAFVLGEDVAKANEVLCSPAFHKALGPPPAGIGTHAAPADRVEEAGFPFHVLRDFRDPADDSSTPRAR